MNVSATERLRALEVEVEDLRWRRSASRREERLRDAARRFAAAASSAGAEAWLRALGIAAESPGRRRRQRRRIEAPPGTTAIRRRVAQALAADRGPEPSPSLPRVAVMACDTAFGPGAALAEAAAHLASGLGVLVLMPPELEELGDEFESLAQDHGVPLAWWVFDEPTAAGAAVELAGSARAARWVATTRPRELPRARVELEAAARRGGAPFGAGVHPGHLPEARLIEIGTGSAWIDPEEDLLRAARRVARAAFGRAVAGGFLAGAVGAVEVHPLVFSEFHDVLLEVLEAHDSPVPALPCARLPGFRSAFDRAFRLALDEGATLLHSAVLERDDDGRPRLARAVFTNVDPTTRTARELEPVGLLRILRAEQRGTLLAPRAASPSNDPR